MTDKRPRQLHRSSRSLLRFLVLCFIYLYCVVFCFPKKPSCKSKAQQQPWKHFEESHDPLCHLIPDASAISIWKKLVDAPNKKSTRILKRGIWNNPSWTSMKRLFSRFDISDQKKTIDVLVLLSSSEDVTWPRELQYLLNIALSREIIQIRTIFNEPDNKTADIIIDATASQDMKKLLSTIGGDSLVATPESANILHNWKQSRIRNILKSKFDECNSPLLVLVNDIVQKHHHPAVLTDTLYTRTIQRLAHWYQLGFVVVSDDDIVQSLAFSLLEWAIGYCSSSAPPLSTRLLLPGVQELVQTVVPPPLGLGTTWQGISDEWEAEKKEQEGMRHCKLS